MDEKRTIIRVRGNTLRFERETRGLELVFDTNSETEYFLVNMLNEAGFIEKRKTKKLHGN